MICDDETCPREGEAPSPAPGPVECGETVVRCVLLQTQLIHNSEGQPVLTAAAFPKDELRGTRGKSVSVLRDKHTAPEETARRAREMNRESMWSSDPVLARGLVISIRNIRDAEGRREVCVNADPTTDENDKLGACPSHASILRANPPLDLTQRLEWQMLRFKLAEQFTEIRHLSGTEVNLTI
jgi:hypothetical protein